MATTKRQSISLKGVKIVSVTSPNRIAQIAAEHSINAQEVFVRVTFEFQGKEYQGSNQLRFFGKDGYSKLISARDSETLVNVTVTKDPKGTLMYLDADKDTTIDDLFAEPLNDKANREDLDSLF